MDNGAKINVGRGDSIQGGGDIIVGGRDTQRSLLHKLSANIDPDIELTYVVRGNCVRRQEGLFWFGKRDLLL